VSKGPAAVSAHDSRYPLGVALILIAGVCLSTGGLLLRVMEAAAGWQIVFYRSIALVVTILIYLTLRYRGGVARSFRDIGWPGVLAGFVIGMGFASYVFAMLLTTVANAVFSFALGPFIAAALARLVLGERVLPATWLAMCVALAGVGLMFADGLAAGRLLGNLVALVPPASFAVMVLIFRRHKRVDMVPAACLGGMLGILIGAVMADGFAISRHDLLLCVLLGSVQVGAGFLLITIGSRHVPAGEVPLFALTEMVLAPIWVWLFVSEVPSLASLAGGGLVLLAVCVAAVVGLRAQAPGRAVRAADP
jgi:drug/metabolite transporter (DMT)-like permease